MNVLLVLVAVLATMPADPAAKPAALPEGNAEGRALIDRAIALHTLKSPGAPGIRLALDLKLPGSSRGAGQAGYALNWMDAGNWAEDLLLPGRRERRGAEHGMDWHQTVGEDPSGLAGKVALLVDPSELLRRTLAEGVVSSPTLHPGDASQTQVNVIGPEGSVTRTLVFDTREGVLVRYEDGEGMVYAYRQFMPIGSASFPARMSLTRKGELLATASLRNARPIKEPELGEFAPPKE